MAIKDQEIGIDEQREPGSDDSLAVDEPPEVVSGKSGKYVSRLETLQKELDLERAKSSDLVNRMRYLQADIANLQRQGDRKVAEVRNQVKLTWILEVLSIKEDLDRAVGIARETNEKSSLLDGLTLVSSRIENILKLESVEVVRARVGGRFDPSLHEALAFQESDTEEQGTILSVISPGYMVDGKVIKPAMVEVARQRERKNLGGDLSFESGRVSGEMEIGEATAPTEG